MNLRDSGILSPRALVGPRPDDRERARAALHAIPADLPRDEWVKAGMAAQAAGLALSDFDAWSATAPDQYQARDCSDTWKSFHGSGIGPGTLFHLARAHGWQDDRRHAPMGSRPTRPQEPRGGPAPEQGHNPRAADIWRRCEPATAAHGYIRAKDGRPDGVRVVPTGDHLTVAGQPLAGALVVPAYDAAGHLQTLQFIPAPGQGRKLNLPGASMAGASFTAGTPDPARSLYLVEGVGQAWACHRATGCAAVCCFGWGNVKTVGAALKRPSGPPLVLVPDTGKEAPARALARELGASVACLPAGEPANFDACDLAQRDGLAALKAILEAAPPPEREPGHPPPAGSLIATEEELSAARLAPRCIVRHHTYADVAQVVAPGGVGKTTLLIHEAVCIAIGRPVWGLSVEAPGWTLIVTAEDRREQILARLREILAAMDLTPTERTTAIRGVRVWDVTGEGVKLIAAADGNIVLSDLADRIVSTYQADPPAVVVFDPLVSFGASEALVNDNEQGIVTAARRIVRGLDCCVRLVHHTGKGNARSGAMDQYSGRGGSALPDGSRMTTVLHRWEEDASERHPPPGCTTGPDVGIVILARAKLSYAPPGLPLIWVRRQGFEFEHFTEPPKVAPEVAAAARVDRLERFIRSELARGRRHTKTSLEDLHRDVGLPRDLVREALTKLRLAGRIVDAPLPETDRQGGRKTYLTPPPNPAEGVRGVGPENTPEGDPTPRPSTTPRPYRGSNPRGVGAGGYDPLSLNPAEECSRGSAGFAGLAQPDPDGTAIGTQVDPGDDIVEVVL